MSPYPLEAIVWAVLKERGGRCVDSYACALRLVPHKFNADHRSLANDLFERVLTDMVLDGKLTIKGMDGWFYPTTTQP